MATAINISTRVKPHDEEYRAEHLFTPASSAPHDSHSVRVAAGRILGSRGMHRELIGKAMENFIRPGGGPGNYVLLL